MKHIARRLLRFANQNKIIHSDEIFDVVLRKFATDKSINHKIRTALHEVDPQLDLLVPYQVDDKERQFKRYLQNEFGLVVNLSALKRDHPSKYRKLQGYGSPVEVLKKWGLDYSYERNIEVTEIPDLLKSIAENGVIRRLYTDNHKLYMAILHQARKENMNVKAYIERLGFTYET